MAAPISSLPPRALALAVALLALGACRATSPRGATPVAHAGSPEGVLAGYREKLLERLGLTPLAAARARPGELEAHLWDYGPWGGMTLVRLRAMAGGALRAETIVFVDFWGTRVSEPRTRRHWDDIQRRYGCRLERPTAARIGVCRAPVTRAAAEAVRDGLARYDVEALRSTGYPGGMDGGWFIVERRRGDEHVTYAYWRPGRALQDSLDTPARFLYPLFQRAATSRQRPR